MNAAGSRRTWSVRRSLAAVAALTLLGGCGSGSSSGGGDADAGTSDAAPPGRGESDGSAPTSPPAASLGVEANGGRFVTFESGQVRPLALSPDGGRLLVTNTPNGTLDVLAVDDEGLSLEASVPVGLEPVAVAARGNDEAWVVNHLSDSVSVVDLATEPPSVKRTLLVGDEPRDIVFAGEGGSLAFVTTARRGQNGPDDRPVDAELFTPGVGRADVWVFDARDTGTTLGGDPAAVVTLFGDTPRALAASPDGRRVHVAVMHSGNRTTVIGEGGIAKRGPVQSADGAVQPDTGLVVRHDGTRWTDETGSPEDLAGVAYDERVAFSLPDYDVFTISATTAPEVLERHAGVGTTLFNMATDPRSGALYVSNTEALNVRRFEGHGLDGETVRGDFARSRITVIGNGAVEPLDLNGHIDRGRDSADVETRRLNVVQPLGLAITADGGRLYVAGFGSGNVAVYDTAALGAGAAPVDGAARIALAGGGPTGLALDEPRGRLYALTRFDNAVAIVDTRSGREIDNVALANPEPARVVEGRALLYEARDFSAHGDSSCALCHVFGDVDGLAWDLGNPLQTVRANPNPFVNFLLTPDGPPRFHPLKGPMSTQSLRGLARAGPMHWRGDRTGEEARPGESVEIAAFKDFDVAFPELLGSAVPPDDRQMTAFAEFALEITYPPNPLRALDNSLTPDQRAGRDIYFDAITTGDAFTCNDCHVLDPAAGRFGTAGRSSVEGSDISQEFKVPHLRNVYQKVGKFGNTGRFSASEGDFGEQIRGFGLMHDGHMDTVDHFLQGDVFRFDADDATNDRERAQVVEFVMAFDSDLAPIVGQQVTLTAASGADVDARVDLLIERARTNLPRAECDLVAKGVVAGEARGYLMEPSGRFRSDRAGERVDAADLRALARAPGGAITFTCVPPGSGTWMGIDRDGDGTLDSD